MSKFRAILPELLSDLAFAVLFCGILPVPGMVILTGSAAGALYGMAFITLCLIFWQIRERVRNFILFCLLHLALAAGVTYAAMALTGNMLFTILICLFTLASLTFSFLQRLSRDPGTLSPGMVVVSAGLYIVAGLVVNQMAGISLFGFYALLVAVMALMLMLKSHIEGVNATLEESARYDAQRSDIILRLNNRLALIFLLIAAVFMGLFAVLPLPRLIRGLLNALLAALRWLFGLLPQGRETEGSVAEAIPEGGMDLSELLGEEYVAREPLIPEEVFQAIIFTAMAVAVVVAICYAIYSMYRRFGEERDASGDLREFIKPPGEDSANLLRRGFSRLRALLPAPPEDRTRRAFYRRVRDFHKRGGQFIESSETAREIAGRMEAADSGIGELERQYSRARYGRGYAGKTARPRE